MAERLNDITKYRRRKRKYSRTRLAATALLIAAVVIAFYFNRDNIADTVKGWFNPNYGVEIFADGFPVMLPGSVSYDFGRIGGNLLLLTDTYLYVYDLSGGQILSGAHGYSSPVFRTSRDKALVFDSNYYDMSVWTRTGKQCAVKLEHKIMQADIGITGAFAAITASESYASTVLVYDEKGEWLYSRNFVDEYATAVHFSEDGNQNIAVAAVGEDGGMLRSRVYFLRTDDTDDIIWRADLPPGDFALGCFVRGKHVVVVSDQSVSSFDSATGELAGSYNFGGTGTLADFCAGDNYLALTLDNATTGDRHLQTVKITGEFEADTIFSYEKVAIFSDMVYTLEGERGLSRRRTPGLTITGEVKLTDDYASLIVVNNAAFFLGGDKIAAEEYAGAGY